MSFLVRQITDPYYGRRALIAEWCISNPDLAHDVIQDILACGGLSSRSGSAQNKEILVAELLTK